MGERRAGLPAAERAARSNAAAARLLALPELADLAGRTIAGYVAVKGELDPASALAQVAAHGGRVVLPRVCAEPPRLHFQGVSLSDITISMSGCCEKLMELANARISSAASTAADIRKPA